MALKEVGGESDLENRSGKGILDSLNKTSLETYNFPLGERIL